MNIEQSRATWQAEPCPPWCVREHHDDDHPDDRYHDSEATLIPAVVAERDLPGGPGRYTRETTELAIVTSRHDDSPDLITFIGRGDRADQQLIMTPESAAHLATALTRHLALIGKAEQTRLGC